MNVKTVYKKQSPLQAVQVTRENLGAAAAWCKGTVVEDRPGRRGVRIPKLSPTANTAYVASYDEDGNPSGGDWIMRDVFNRYHIVHHDAYQTTYVEVRRPAPDQEPSDDGTP